MGKSRVMDMKHLKQLHTESITSGVSTPRVGSKTKISFIISLGNG